MNVAARASQLAARLASLPRAARGAIAVGALVTLCVAAWLADAAARAGADPPAQASAPSVATAPPDAPGGEASVGPGSAGAGRAPVDLSRQSALEQDLASRAESLLAHVTGADRVAVRVRAELDWSARERTRERFDPTERVETSEERSTDPGAGRGERTTERVAYDVGRETVRESTPGGVVRRLHVAVLLSEREAPAGPWSAAERARLEALVKQAVGFSADRGDTLALEAAPFAGSHGAMRWLRGADALPIAAFGVAAVCVLLAFRRRADDAFSGLPLPMPAGELEAALATAEDLADDAGAPAALPEPDAGAATLRAWLRER